MWSNYATQMLVFVVIGGILSILLFQLSILTLLAALIILVIIFGYCPDIGADEGCRRWGSAASEHWPLATDANSTCRTTAHVRRWQKTLVGDQQQADLVVVCLHGTFSSSHEFEDWAKNLQEEAIGENIEVIGVDLPGHGLTGPWQGAKGMPTYSLDADVEFLRQVLDCDKIAGKRVVLVGHSIGGRIAVAFMSRYANLVSGLVLVAPWGLRHGSQDPAMQHCVWFVKFALSPRWRFLSLWLFLLVVRITPKLLVRYAMRTAFGPGAPDSSNGDPAPQVARVRLAADIMQGLMLCRGNRRTFVTRINHFIAQERAALQESARSRVELSSIRCPVQLQWGEVDTWLHVSRCPSWVEALGAHAVDVQIWPGVGHCVLEQTPRRSAEAAWSFVQKFVIMSNGVSLARAQLGCR